MRDAAKDVHSAIKDGDPDRAQKALKPLTRTCDDCHELFRD
jgi:cytochrome c556